MADTRIIDLPDLLTISEGCFVAVDSDSDNTRRYDLSQVAATTDANVIASAAERAAQVATEEAERRIDSAIDAMGDISEQAVPVMSADVRGGAKIQPDSGLEISGTDNLQVRLALESEGDVRGGILGLTAKGHAEQNGTPTPDNPVPIEVVRGRNLLPGNTESLTSTGNTAVYPMTFVNLPAGTYTLKFDTELTSGAWQAVYNSDASSTGQTVIDTKQLPTKELTFTVAEPMKYFKLYVTSAGTYSNIQLELGSTPTPYVPYGHVGMEVQGRNLLNSDTILLYHYIDANGNVVPFSSWSCSDYIPVTGTVRLRNIESGTNPRNCWYDKHKRLLSTFKSSSDDETIPVPDGAAYIRISTTIANIQSASLTFTTTTHIPLPQRGWVAGLSDGTADVLTLDGAGKVTWELGTNEVVFDGSSDEGWNQQNVYTNNARYSFVTDAAFNKSNGGQLLCSHLPEGNAGSDSANIDLHGSLRMIQMTVPYLTVADFKTWLSTHNVTVLYPLATPVTEDCGYCEDWPTDIPEGAVIDIPELSEVGIKFFIDSSVTELAKQWYARAHSEYEDRLEALESAVAELVTGA